VTHWVDKLFPTIILLVISGMMVGCKQSSTHYQGYIETAYVYLAVPYSGKLKTLTVDRGNQVKAGQLLFVLDPDPQQLVILESQASLMQAKQTLQDLIAPKRKPEIDSIIAQIGQAEAQIKLASSRVRRNQILVSKHVLDQDSLDAIIEKYDEAVELKAQYEAQLDLAKLGSRINQIAAQSYQVQSLEAKLQQAQWQLEQKTIYAPMDSYVFDTYFTEGEFVDASRPVLSLLVPENIRVEFFVPAKLIPSLHLGQKIEVLSEDHAKKYFAKISYISSLAEYVPPLVYSRDNLDKLAFKIKAIPIIPMSLKPGQPVEVVFHKNNQWHKAQRLIKTKMHIIEQKLRNFMSANL
jgi:HlyD family secretion protein